ncbi:alpha/beta hydrolase family protein [Modestobacter versicolor]|uniref:alpha/beta hydrolase family protein n=1 Tax=Modestobacter versicolor TaxID=429133 RepID=UPI0034E05552
MLLMLLTLAGCTGGAAGTAGRGVVPERTVTDVLAGQRVRLDPPTSGRTVGVALWFHGQTGDVDSYMGSAWLDAIRARGWAVASSDLHGNAWGSPAAVRDARELARWAARQARAEVRLLVAGSMGGATSLNALLDGAVSAPCWYGTEVVVDLGAVSAVPGATAELLDVYGGPPPARSNPARRLAGLPASMRWFVVTSPDDTWVPAAAHGDVLVAALRAQGASVGTAVASGEHGDLSYFRPEDLVAFADRCAGDR